MNTFTVMEFSISPTLGIKERIAERKGVLNFGLGQSPFPVIPSMVEALSENANQNEYMSVQGLPELRSQIAAFHEKTDKLSIDPKNIIVGPGSKELLFSLLFTNQATVFIPTPCWVTYRPQCRMTNQEMVMIHCNWEDHWKLTPELVEETFQRTQTRSTKFIILNFPNNPCGYTYSYTEIQNITRVCHRYRVTIISDEIYGGLTHSGYHSSSLKFNKNAILSSGISKWAGAGGWRLGYMAFTDESADYLRKLRQMVSETYTSVSAPIQYGALEAFKSSSIVDEYLRKARRTLSLVAEEIRRILGEIPSLKVSQMEGGFYFFLDISSFRRKLGFKGISTSGDLASYLLHNLQIAALPGVFFGRPDEELSMRFSYVDFTGSDIMKCESINEDIIRKHCHKVFEGVHRLKTMLLEL